MTWWSGKKNQNIHSFTYQKNYFIHFRCLFLKSSRAFTVSLRLMLATKIICTLKLKAPCNYNDLRNVRILEKNDARR